MQNKIKACQTPEDLHNIGVEIDMSSADKSVKKPLYELIEARLKVLNDVMAERDNADNSDMLEFYHYEE